MRLVAADGQPVRCRRNGDESCGAPVGHAETGAVRDVDSTADAPLVGAALVFRFLIGVVQAKGCPSTAEDTAQTIRGDRHLSMHRDLTAAPRRVRIRWLIVGVILVAVVAAVTAGWSGVQRYTGTLAPPQFAGPANPTLLPDDQAVLGIAHNAGNHPDTTAAALRHGADVLEIDVVQLGGNLVAGRDQPVEWMRDLVFIGPRLTEVWRSTATGDVVLLDLKQNDDALVDQLIQFLDQHAGSRRVLVSSAAVDVLHRLQRELPSVSTVLTLAWPRDVAHLHAQPSLHNSLDGVSIFHQLIDAELLRWFHERGLLVLAWTVNDAREVTALIRQGVDGITTDNLTILQALADTTEDD